MNALSGTALAASVAARGASTTSGNLPKPDSSPQARKLMNECRQFEGILIANLWNQMEKGMGLMDQSSDAGSGTMQGFGIQAAALGIAKAGGLGIARMLYHELAPQLKNSPSAKPSTASSEAGKSQ